jgi:hypothetical protein
MKKRTAEAIANRIPAAKNGGTSCNPILIASHVDPQTKLTTKNPNQTRTRSEFIVRFQIFPHDTARYKYCKTNEKGP